MASDGIHSDACQDVAAEEGKLDRWVKNIAGIAPHPGRGGGCLADPVSAAGVILKKVIARGNAGSPPDTPGWSVYHTC